MRLGHLVNQYPKTSHTFVRREIHALEQLGASVARYAIRTVDEPLVSAEDRSEAKRTRTLLSGSRAGLLARALLVAASRPLRFLDALRATLQLGRRSDRGLLRHVAYLVEACTLFRWVRGDGIQHLHAHFGTNPAAVALLCRRLGGPPFSFTAHGTETFDFPPFIGVAQKIRESAFTVAVCDHGRSQLCRWSDPESSAKIHVVRCGVDESLRNAKLTPVPESPRFVCVARFSREKGHDVLLRACSILRERGKRFELVLVGDGELRAAVEAEVRARGLEAEVTFAGWQTGSDLESEVLAARALVLPSYAEGLPVVLMEAFAWGRPVIASCITGIPELVRPGKSGWLVPAGSAPALADAMEEVLATPPEHLGAMATHGRAAVFELHDAERESARLLELIEGHLGAAR